MRANFNSYGIPIPPALHIPQTLAQYPYVPHPLMIAGIIPAISVLGAAPSGFHPAPQAGHGAISALPNYRIAYQNRPF